MIQGSKNHFWLFCNFKKFFGCHLYLSERLRYGNLWLESRDVINFMNMSWDISKFYIHDYGTPTWTSLPPAYVSFTDMPITWFPIFVKIGWWCDYKNNLQIFKFLCDIMPSAMIMTHWIIKGGLLSQWERSRSTVDALKNVFVHPNLLKGSKLQWIRMKEKSRHNPWRV